MRVTRSLRSHFGCPCVPQFLHVLNERVQGPSTLCSLCAPALLYGGSTRSKDFRFSVPDACGHGRSPGNTARVSFLCKRCLAITEVKRSAALPPPPALERSLTFHYEEEFRDKQQTGKSLCELPPLNSENKHSGSLARAHPHS